MKLKFFILCLFALLSFVAYKTYRDYSFLKSINSYESCTAAKGSIIQESYPATCVTHLGSRYIQPNITPVMLNIAKDWETYNIPDTQVSFQYPPNLTYIEFEDGSVRFFSDKNKYLSCKKLIDAHTITKGGDWPCFYSVFYFVGLKEYTSSDYQSNLQSYYLPETYKDQLGRDWRTNSIIFPQDNWISINNHYYSVYLESGADDSQQLGQILSTFKFTN